VKPGDVYNAEQINGISKAITDRMSTLGYAFASANAVPDANRETREVAFTIVVDPGRRVYVRRVNVGGNTRTRDEVIRREIRQFEAGWFDADRVRLSKERLDRLGYFETVTVDTPAVPTAPDQVDVNVTVKERATGNIQLGAGYSSSEGLVITAGLSQTNLFGTGNALAFEVNTSKSNTVFSITHTDPYISPEGISRTIELYYRDSNLAELGLASVGYNTRGAGLVYGIPFTEYDRVFLGLRYEGTQIDLTPTSPPRYIEYVQDFGDNSDGLAVTGGWSRDSRDSLIIPTRGRYQRAFAEVSIL
jgi:outer membrane protein insertion porin family